MAARLGGPRSPLLVAPPTDRRRDLQHRRRLRILALVIVVAILLLLSGPIVSQLLLAQDAGFAFARLHDRLLLPLYSFFVTRFHPLSYSWCLSLTGLLLLSGTGFVLARPPSRRLHIALLRLALRRRRSQKLLLRWGQKRWLARLGTGMVRAVVEHDRRVALQQLEVLEPAAAGQEQPALARLAAQVVDLSLLRGRLQPPGAGERLHRVNDLAEVLLPLLLLIGHPRSAQSPAQEPLQELLAELELLLAAPSPPSSHHCFSLAVLEHELLALLQHLRSELLSEVAQPPDLGPVLAGIRQRRSLVDSLRRQLEQQLFGTGGGGAISSEHAASEQLPTEAVAGRLAILLSLLVAVLWQVPELATAYLDSLDALWFCLQASGPATAAETGPAVAGERLCQALPRPSDYRICAWLLDQRLAGATELLDAAAAAGTVLTSDDLELMGDRINRLFAAAADPRRARFAGGREGA